MNRVHPPLNPPFNGSVYMGLRESAASMFSHIIPKSHGSRYGKSDRYSNSYSGQLIQMFKNSYRNLYQESE
jgi:hypothetical protein